MIDSWAQQKMLEDLVSKISYRPGYEITVAPWDLAQRDYHMGAVLLFSKTDDDPRHWASAETGQPQVRLGYRQTVPRYIDEPEEALRYVRRCLREFEAYIADQWLRVDGGLVKDVSG